MDIDLIEGRKRDLDGNNYIQLLGNCSCIGYLGENRIRGPIDNCLSKGVETIKALLDNTYIEKLKTVKPNIFNRAPSYNGDLSTGYDYDFIQIIHNNPTEQKYLDEISKRVDTFNTFYEQLKTHSNYYFVVCFNMYDIDNQTNKANIERVKEILECLKQYNVLDKTIFVQTKTVNKCGTANWWSKDLDGLIRQYKLKMLTIEDNQIWGEGIEPSHRQFLNKVAKLLPEH